MTDLAGGAHFQLYQNAMSSPVRWRLLGGNNRPIGRSALDYPEVPDCLQALAELRQRLAELAGRVDRQPPNHWVWRIFLDGTDVAVSSHPYDRQIRSQHGLSQFLHRAGSARIDGGVLVNASTRRWRSLPDRGVS